VGERGDDEIPRVGLVLSGGGARGAYEVGVLQYVREQIKRSCNFHVITGSSVGAINGSYLAATADRPRAQTRPLVRVWSELDLDQMYRIGWSQVRHLPQLLFGRSLPKDGRVETVGGLVDSGYIEDFVRRRIPWKGLHHNLGRGHLSAFACSATELATGKTTVFVQTRPGAQRPWPVDPGNDVVHTNISAAHALASAAIPVLFPAVRVGEQYYVDGSLRQNTPVRPAMRLGANRLLVVGLRYEHADDLAERARAQARTVYPNAVFMGGKLLDALMLDKLEADLRRIERLNEIIDAGRRMYGPDFGQKLASAIPGRRGAGERPGELRAVRPRLHQGADAARLPRRAGAARPDRGVVRLIGAGSVTPRP